MQEGFGILYGMCRRKRDDLFHNKITQIMYKIYRISKGFPQILSVFFIIFIIIFLLIISFIAGMDFHPSLEFMALNS